MPAPAGGTPRPASAPPPAPYRTGAQNAPKDYWLAPLPAVPCCSATPPDPFLRTVQWSESSRTSATIVSPGSLSPLRSSEAMRLSSSVWLVRHSGRAPKLRLIAVGDQQLLCRFAHFQRQALRADAVLAAVQEVFDDLGQVFLGEAVEDDDVVDAVEELGQEPSPQIVHQLVLELGGVTLVGEDAMSADVGRHDDHAVAEVDRAALSVGEAAVVEDLEQRAEDVGVRPLHLVEQHHAVRHAADLLGELPPAVTSGQDCGSPPGSRPIRLG